VTPVELRIISIGTLSAHPLWDEGADVRTGHTTTTLIKVGDARIIVDPGLPAQAVAARLAERCPVRPEQITHVFLTSFVVDHYRGLPAFEGATWLVHEPEIEAARTALEEQVHRAHDIGDPDLVAAARQHVALLDRCRPAEDSIAPGVDLFPLPGVTPGTCGLLLPLPRTTVLACGDAVATSEHVEQGKVLPTCMDIEQARESFREALEIADVFIPGRDNIIVNPLRDAWGGAGQEAARIGE
jgi:glyoxylase-like metal-dependent hydrolase (beta-lactamase superfamily II)